MQNRKVAQSHTVIYPLGGLQGLELDELLQRDYYSKGWDLFDTHVIGQGTDANNQQVVNMAYVLVKYEDNTPYAVAPAPAAEKESPVVTPVTSTSEPPQ